MKKLIIVVIFCIFTGFIFADCLAATFDLGLLQDVVIRTDSYQFSTDFRYLFKNKYELRLPVSLSLTPSNRFIDVGLFLNYYPWQNHGLFMGLSLVQFGFVTGETSLEKNTYALNEINLGWTFNLFKGFVLEPSLLIRDPSGTYSDEYEMLKGLFPCNRSFRIRLAAGWKFDLKN